MPDFSIKPTQSKLFLSWESTYQLLQDVKQPHTRQQAFNILLQAHADDIAAMCRSTPWAIQWGFEDAYQEAVTHFFETALRTDDPAELKSYWNLRNAVRKGAARNIYPISVSPHLARKLRCHSFSRDLDLISIPRSKSDPFDETGWHLLLSFCHITVLLSKIFNKETADYFTVSLPSPRGYSYYSRVGRLFKSL
jgi:hypothetical protein